MLLNQKNIYHTAFLFLLVIAVFLTLPWHQGFAIGDCAAYLYAANDLLHGKWNIQSNFYANRIGTYLPYTIGMNFFGFGKWLTLITTIEFLLLLSAVYVIVSKYDRSAGFIAACLLGISPLLHQNASLIMGDLAATLTAGAVMLCVFYFRFYVFQKERTGALWGITTALLFVVSFLTKESVVFFIPLLGWFFWHDRENSEMKMYWKGVIATLVISGIAIVVLYWIKTGNPLYRFAAVEVGPSSSECNYAQAGWLTILNRITWQPFLFLTENLTYGSLVLLATLQVITRFKNGSLQENFFNTYFIGTLALWWFGSQGFTSYNPVALVHRVWLPLVVPMAINSSLFVLHVIRNDISVAWQRKSLGAAIVYLIISLTALLVTTLNHYTLQLESQNIFFTAGGYLFIVFSLAAAYYSGQPMEVVPQIRSLFFIMVCSVFLLSSYQNLIWYVNNKHDHKRNLYDSEKEMVQYALQLKPEKIITDNWIVRGYHIYIGFNETVSVMDYNSCDSTTEKKGAYLLINKLRQQELLHGITETRTYVKAAYTVSDVAVHPSAHGFTLVKENETNCLYQFTGK